MQTFSRQNLSSWGARLMVETSCPKLKDGEKKLLEELRPKAFLFRTRNFRLDLPYPEWLATFTTLLSDIRNAVGHSHLLLSIDHEGGRVTRPPLPITRFPYAAAWKDKAPQIAAAMAVELKSLGLNVNWAPVADVNTNPDNKVIGQRAFASTAEGVISAAVPVAQAFMQNGITPAAKHFPGHGGTTEDSHFALPVLKRSLDDLRNIDLPPFSALIKAQVPLIMTAHIKVPVLDQENIATLSEKILKGLLRDEMGFKGVVVADALGMGAIAGERGKDSSIVKALNADLDLFCLAGDNITLQKAKETALQMQAALEKGLVSEETAQAAAARIDALINSLPQHQPTLLQPATLATHADLAHQVDPSDKWRQYCYIPKGFD